MGEQFGGTSHANYARFDAIRVAFRFLFNSRTTLSAGSAGRLRCGGASTREVVEAFCEMCEAKN